MVARRFSERCGSIGMIQNGKATLTTLTLYLHRDRENQVGLAQIKHPRPIETCIYLSLCTWLRKRYLLLFVGVFDSVSLCNNIYLSHYSHQSIGSESERNFLFTYLQTDTHRRRNNEIGLGIDIN